MMGSNSKENAPQANFSSTANGGETNLAGEGPAACLPRSLSECHVPDCKYQPPGVTKDLQRSRSLPAVVGGVRTPGALQAAQQAYKKRMEENKTLKEWLNERRFFFVFTLFTLSWITTGALFYYFYYGWSYPQAFYYTINAGMSIGWCEGTLSETTDVSRLFTIFLILLGSSVVAGGLNLFVSYALVEERRLTLSLYDKPPVIVWDDDNQAPIEEEQVTRMQLAWMWLCAFVEENKRLLSAVLALFLWLGVGVVFGVLWYGFTPIQALYFSISTVATGGLQGIYGSKGGWLFVGGYALIGIPLYAYTCAMIATLFLRRHIANRTKRSLNETLSREEFEYASTLISRDGKVEWSEFLLLELLRLELVDAETVAMIHDKFVELDRDGSGYLTADELLPMKRIPSLIGLRAQQSYLRKAAEREKSGNRREGYDPEAQVSGSRVTSL